MTKRPKPPANHTLQRARLRLPSPSAPQDVPKPMSRQELADAVNAWLAPKHPDEATLDANHIGKLERGVYRWPSRARRDAFRHVLGVQTDADLGFYIVRGLASAHAVTVDVSSSGVVGVVSQHEDAPISSMEYPVPEWFGSSQDDQALRFVSLLGSTADGMPTPRTAETSADMGGEGMHRRTFLQSMAWTLGAGRAADCLLIDSGQLGNTPSSDERSLDDWFGLSELHGRRCMTDPPGEMESVLRADLLLLQRNLHEAARPELWSVAAKLSTLYAMTVASLGNVAAAVGWYQVAKQAADAGDDVRLAAWVRGREVLRSDYDGYATPEQILTFVHDSSGLAGQPSIARMEIMVAAARAYARLGEHRRAAVALTEARRAYEAVPHLTTNTESMYYLPEWRFLLRGAFVFAMAGDTAAVDRLLDEAAAGRRATDLLRWSVQIELNRALAAARNGEDDTATVLAVPIVERTPRSQQTQTMRQLVGTLCSSLQYGPRRDAAAHLRKLVATP